MGSGRRRTRFSPNSGNASANGSSADVLDVLKLAAREDVRLATVDALADRWRVRRPARPTPEDRRREIPHAAVVDASIAGTVGHVPTSSPRRTRDADTGRSDAHYTADAGAARTCSNAHSAKSNAAPRSSAASPARPAGGNLAIDRRGLAIFTSGDGVITAWDPEGGHRVARVFPYAKEERPGCQAYSCSVTDPNSPVMPTLMADGRVALLDLRTKRPLGVLPARDGTPAEAIAFFAGGRRLATGGTAGTVTIWDLPSRTVVSRLRFLEPVWATAVSPDGTLIAVLRKAESAAEVHVEVRDVASGATRYTRTIGFGPGGVAFSADGSTLIAAGCCGDPGATVTAWDAPSGAQRFHRDAAAPFAVSPVGRTLALGTGDGRVLVLDARTGAQRSQMKVSSKSLQQIVFSPDGRVIAALPSGTPGTLWDIRSGKRIGGQFPQIPGSLAGMHFQPDGHLLLFELHFMVEWPTDTPTLRRSACEIAGRDLTREEWKALLPNRPYRNVCRS